ncbi:MAG: hypothetical protein MUF49_20820 [Oculatellaceae cyanobacterium Prado106]|jgi:hypothetical protein|nr:hypothetical protein [Oculatellaceae cyanobacterium Prado106]
MTGMRRDRIYKAASHKAASHKATSHKAAGHKAAGIQSKAWKWTLISALAYLWGSSTIGQVAWGLEVESRSPHISTAAEDLREDLREDLQENLQEDLQEDLREHEPA